MTGTGGALRVGTFGLLLLLTAGTLDIEALYVPGAALLLVAAGAAGAVRLLVRDIAVDRALAHERVQEGQLVRAAITVRASRVPLPSATLEDPLLAAPAVIAGGRRGWTITGETRYARRGRVVLDPPRLVVRDPFSLAAAAVTGREGELLVLPRIHPVTRADGGGAGDASGRRPAPAGVAAEVELDGLRPLQAGTSAARIAWAVWARSGELHERRLQPDGDDRPIIVLDARAAPAGSAAAAGLDPQDALDAAVRAAASLCVHLAARGGCALLLPGDRRPAAVEPGLAGWPRLHARLALAGADGAPTAAALTGRTGAVFYVTPQPAGPVPPLLARAHGRSQVLVVPEPASGGDRAGRTAVFAVAGCRGYDLTPRTAAGRGSAGAAGRGVRA